VSGPDAKARRPVGAEFFRRPVLKVARDLIGVELLVDGVGGIIVETEAYDRLDPASHAFGGLKVANAVMFGPPGRAYVYRSYGLHWCLNLVCGPEPGAAALIRALEPTEGVETMSARRGTKDLRKLCSGPGRLCQALDVTRAQNDLALDRPPFMLTRRSRGSIVTGVRIGLTKGVETPWRFGLAGSPFLSRPFRDEAPEARGG
jgi:DNA-3-methyladenine glycosylase